MREMFSITGKTLLICVILRERAKQKSFNNVSGQLDLAYLFKKMGFLFF